MVYVSVASLSIMLWDILDNLKNDYRLLFRHRLGPPTMVYFLSRLSVLGYVLAITVFLTTPSVSCTALETTFVAFSIVALISTLFLSYFRVCAVWRWNRVIVGIFGISWLSVAASSFTLLKSIHGSSTGEGFCAVTATQLVLAPFVTSFVNHIIVFLAITYGVCKNTIGRDLGFRDCVWLMFGKGLPTFSKALLHDSQLCYILTMGITITTVVWFQVWLAQQSSSPFRLALVSPYFTLVNIMICRVFRNTKLGLYSKVPVQPNDSKRTHGGGMSAWSSRYNNDSHSDSIVPIQIAVSQVVEYKSDYPPLMRSKTSEYLDFGML